MGEGRNNIHNEKTGDKNELFEEDDRQRDGGYNEPQNSDKKELASKLNNE